MTPLDLRQYCDLTDSELAALLNPAGATQLQRVVLSGDGLLDLPTLTLTDAGDQLRDRAQRLIQSQEPRPAPLTLPPAGRISAQLTCLRYVAEHPGVAWRYLTQIYGRDVVAQCHYAGWFTGKLRRGAPQELTRVGIKYVQGEN